MKYEQPHTIRNQLNKLEKFIEGNYNPAFKEYLVDYEHHKAKRMARYNKSKYSKRMK